MSTTTLDLQSEKVIGLARERGAICAADLEPVGCSRTLLPYLSEKGVLRRITRGVYALADYMPENEAFLATAAAVPHGVICLLSALQFHEITTQMPVKTWVAIKRGTRMPTCRGLSLQVVKLTEPAFSEGIEEHGGDAIPIHVYSAGKTVVDCFKFRNRIGLDIALEALRDALDQKKTTRDELWRLARCCRMARVMRPYLEMTS